MAEEAAFYTSVAGKTFYRMQFFLVRFFTHLKFYPFLAKKIKGISPCPSFVSSDGKHSLCQGDEYFSFVWVQCIFAQDFIFFFVKLLWFWHVQLVTIRLQEKRWIWATNASWVTSRWSRSLHKFKNVSSVFKVWILFCRRDTTTQFVQLAATGTTIVIIGIVVTFAARKHPWDPWAKGLVDVGGRSKKHFKSFDDMCKCDQ